MKAVNATDELPYTVFRPPGKGGRGDLTAHGQSDQAVATEKGTRRNGCPLFVFIALPEGIRPARPGRPGRVLKDKIDYFSPMERL
jgi:hypothetical protein